MVSRDEQLQWELSTDAQAVSDRLNELREGVEAGATDLPKTQRFIAKMYTEVAEYIESQKPSTHGGRNNKYRGWLRKIPSETAAVIAIRTAISEIQSATARGKVYSPQTLYLSIGRQYETEVRVAEAEAVNPVYMKKVYEQIKDRQTSSVRHIRRVLNVAYDRVMKGELDSELSSVECIHLGQFGVHALINAGIVYISSRYTKQGTLQEVELVPEVAQYLSVYNEDFLLYLVNSQTGIMRCPPDKWSTVDDGGYLSLRRKQAAPLFPIQRIRKSERARVRKLFTPQNMPKVFNAVNELQSTAFSIHTKTLEAIKSIWQAGGGCLGIPNRNPPQKPDFPFHADWKKEDCTPEELPVLIDWKRKVSVWHSEKRSRTSHILEVSRILKISAAYGENPLWFSMYMDRRGRLYYRGTPTPQGSDIAKALLHFAIKKPLGPRGVYWLRVHIANSYGYDKVRLDERAEWTVKNWPRIQAALSHPEDHPDVWGTDSPWCMYSAALELQAALASGNPEQYKTGIPIHMDATCSGLQHFSALLKDSVGGRFVNLQDETGTGPKQDIYAKVASVALAAMQKDLVGEDTPEKEHALWWTSKGIQRSLAKKPVMTKVYGATLRGTVEFIQDYMERELHDPAPGEKPQQYYRYLAKKLFEGIASTVPSAEAGMDWLIAVAKEWVKNKGTRMEWKTPSGFVVQHDYQELDSAVVELRSLGRKSMTVQFWGDGIRSSGMQNAIAPNFVHALDASHLVLTANSMYSKGSQLVVIHDSFGTYPADVDLMQRCIREEFVGMYSGNILGEFVKDTQSELKIPSNGDLNVRSILNSEFFFS